MATGFKLVPAGQAYRTSPVAAGLIDPRPGQTPASRRGSRADGAAALERDQAKRELWRRAAAGGRDARRSWEQNCGWFIAGFCIDLDR